MTSRPVPRATYRLQLHRGFRFADAAVLAPYLGRLGIGHAYLSPILMARPGSTHGYDTVDHTRVNPELGTLDEFRAMAAAFRAHGLGIVLDIVPNHMGIGGADNALWLNVLEWGEASRFASWFDIDWQSPEPGLAGKVLVPFLDRPYAVALEDGSLRLKFDAEAASFAVWVADHHKLPVDPRSYPAIFGECRHLAPLAESFGGLGNAARAIAAARRQLGTALEHTEAALALAHRLACFNGIDGHLPTKMALDALIARQNWRIAKADVADHLLNYRRFFAVSDLAGIQIEQPDVFEHVHRLIFDLIEEGLVEGLRVDHIDGLVDPRAYARRLREQSPRPVYLIVEKILAADEPLPADWEVDGTTGYEFASLVTPLLVDPAADAALTEFDASLTGQSQTPADLEHAAKLAIIDGELAAEHESLTRQFAELARRNLATRDLSAGALRQALRAVVAAMPVYRTYLTADGLAPEERETIRTAIGAARRLDRRLDDDLMDFLERVLTGDFGEAEERDAAIRLAMRVQQFTGPVMAKGLEDTALYRDQRLIALNDVGERPDRFSLPVAAFHAANRERQRRFPHSLLATSTHDSKRGEDVRARLAALSGHAEAWITEVPRWLDLLARRGGPAINPADAYQLLQLLLGAWPVGLASGTMPETLENFADRLVAAMRKSLREARLRSDWRHPDAGYEAAVASFIRVALDPSEGNAFLADFAAFSARLGADGARNGLIMTTLKLTVPGVPDVYQGADLWEQSTVDPDNRRPVDFARRSSLLEASRGRSLHDLFGHWPDGAAKQRLIARLLALRAAAPDMFANGSYEPVNVHPHICAFVRRHEGRALFVAVGLHPWRTTDEANRVTPPDQVSGPWWDALGGDGTGPADDAASMLDPNLPILVRVNFPVPGQCNNAAGRAAAPPCD